MNFVRLINVDKLLHLSLCFFLVFLSMRNDLFMRFYEELKCLEDSSDCNTNLTFSQSKQRATNDTIRVSGFIFIFLHHFHSFLFPTSSINAMMMMFFHSSLRLFSQKFSSSSSQCSISIFIRNINKCLRVTTTTGKKLVFCCKNGRDRVFTSSFLLENKSELISSWNYERLALGKPL